MRVVRVEAPSNHDVLVGEGALDRISPGPGRIAVLVDEKVEQLHGDLLRTAFAAHRPIFRVVPPGEQHKTVRSAEALWDWFGAIRLERGERVVAVGGGVVGDLAGFSAAAWRRGVNVVQVPTTLLAMVDSSVGGKVGVDTVHGKNLVGAFWPPAQVLVDPRFLATLPVKERWCGLAEVVKTALLSGGALFAQVESRLEAIAEGTDAAEDVIEACIAFKADVVRRDPLEGGERAILNLGHTIGHALEAAGGFDRIAHGEAVAWGLRAALSLSGLDPDGRERRLVERLPAVSLSGIDVDEVVAALASDKKSSGGRPRFVLLERAGLARWGCEIEPAVWRAQVEQLLGRSLEMDKRRGA